MPKQYILSCILLTGCLWASRVLAQQSSPDSAAIPPFLIALENGVHFSKAQLKPDKPFLLVYFSPTCEHCQHFGQALSARIDQFKGAQIVMITFRPLNEVTDFARTCHLQHTPVLLGSEGIRFEVQKYYNINRFPFVAAYNRHGKLTGIYRDPPDLDRLRKDLFGKSTKTVVQKKS